MQNETHKLLCFLAIAWMAAIILMIFLDQDFPRKNGWVVVGVAWGSILLTLFFDKCLECYRKRQSHIVISLDHDSESTTFASPPGSPPSMGNTMYQSV
jgi:hypothetical protein